ncbi:AEC family transporter [Oscillospiraceae bacterium MB08-C2-2]|nr:AEC family transporter [Oscillospiraceae bacterium MB08-C2-2]
MKKEIQKHFQNKCVCVILIREIAGCAHRFRKKKGRVGESVENFLLSVRVVLPLFLLMMLGYFLRKWKFWDVHTMEQLNKITFKIFLPALLFMNIYDSDLDDLFNPRLLGFGVISVLAIFTLAVLAVMLLEKDNKKRGVLIQGIFRSNFILFGMPVAISIYGEGNLGSSSILYATTVPLFNVLAVVTLEVFCGTKVNVAKTLKGVVANPLIISSLLGMAMLLLRIPIPVAVHSALRDVSRLATPLALALLGGLFDFSSARGNLKQLIIGVGGRLLVIPAICLPIAISMGFRDVELVSLLTLFSAPTAVSSFTMAKQAGGDSRLAAQLVVFGTAFSVLTVFMWIFLTKQGGYF